MFAFVSNVMVNYLVLEYLRTSGTNICKQFYIWNFPSHWADSVYMYAESPVSLPYKTSRVAHNAS